MSIKSEVNRIGNLERQLSNLKDHAEQILSHLRGARLSQIPTATETPNTIMLDLGCSLTGAEDNANAINEALMELGDIIGIHDDKSVAKVGFLSGHMASKSDRF